VSENKNENENAHLCGDQDHTSEAWRAAYSNPKRIGKGKGITKTLKVTEAKGEVIEGRMKEFERTS